ncbi:MAG: DUF2442 domain-containing protein [Oceanicaulis sp.]
MTSLAIEPDTRVEDVRFDADSLIVGLKDGRTISAPLAWFPRLLNASPCELAAFEVAGGGYGLHWPKLDEDLSIDGLLRGAPSVEARR